MCLLWHLLLRRLGVGLRLVRLMLLRRLVVRLLRLLLVALIGLTLIVAFKTVVALIGALTIVLLVILLTVLLLLLEARIQNAIIMVGVLEVIFRQNAVTGGTGVTRHIQELFHELLGIAPHAPIVV